MDGLAQFPLAPILVAIAPLLFLGPFLLKRAISDWLDKLDNKPSMDMVKLYVKEELDARFKTERVLYKNAAIALLRRYLPRPIRREET